MSKSKKRQEPAAQQAPAVYTPPLQWRYWWLFTSHDAQKCGLAVGPEEAQESLLANFLNSIGIRSAPHDRVAVQGLERVNEEVDLLDQVPHVTLPGGYVLDTTILEESNE